MKEYQSFFRDSIDALAGYVPGEQPKVEHLVKLNTNENPFPPSPAVLGALETFDATQLRRYPDPMADALCQAIAGQNGVSRDMVIAGNGSDDILTMAFRAFAAPDKPVAVMEPSYSLYPVLAAMQEAPVVRVPLVEQANFALPEDVLERVKGANLLMLTCPNAPTGNSFPLEKIRWIAEKFNGILFIDEAYADFADANCMALVKEYSNVIVSRTASKSYALAGLRFGFAVAHPKIIEGLLKLKDSYNLDMLAQHLALAAVKDQGYLRHTVEQVRALRAELTRELEKRRFKVIPSQANFLFAMPPRQDGQRVFPALRDAAIVVRYFPGEVTGKYLRITIGTAEQNRRLLDTLDRIL